MATRIQTMKVADLKPAPYNPRRIDPAAMQGLTKSIERFGVVETLVWNERTNHLVGGHQRLKVMRAQKITETPVTVVDLDEIDEKALNVALNSQHIAGDFTDALQGILAEIAASSEQLYADLRFDELIAEIVRPALHGDPDDVPEPPAIAITKPGDVWTLGRHRLICGDSSDSSVIALLLGDDRVEMLLTDPPYGMNLDADFSKIKGSAKAQIKGPGVKHRQVIGDNKALDASGLRKQFAATREQFWFGADYYRASLSPDDRDGSWLVWDKRNEGSDAVIGSGFELVWSAVPHKRDVLRYYWQGAFGDPEARNRVHPTQKPTKLLIEILERWSDDDCIVADPFGGSGSTLIACEASLRRARLCEIDALYCDVIAQRYCNATGKPALLNGEPQDAITPQG